MRSKFDYFKGGHSAGFFRPILSVLCIGLMFLGMAQESAFADVSLQGRVSGQDEEGNSTGVIANATVEILSEGNSPAGTATTNETGFFQITGLQPGSYLYRVSADDYTSEDAGRGVTIPNGGDGFVLDFILTKGDLTPPANGSLSGQVLVEKDGVRTPGLGARVVASRSAGTMVVERSVDGEGNYLLDLPAGEWKMSAILPGRPPHVNPEIVTTDPKTPATVDFIFMEAPKEVPSAPTEVHLLTSVPEAGKSAGVPSIIFVNRKDGGMTAAKVSPATEAQLLEGGLAPDKRTRSLVWYYAKPVESLPEGSFYAEANLDNYSTAQSTARKVVGGEEIWFDVAFVPVKKINVIDLTDQGTPAMPKVSSVTGRVSGVHETGEYLGVVAGAKVEFLDGSGRVTATAMTNETGFYEVDALGAGKWTYRVTASDYAAEDAGRGFELGETSGVQVYDFNLFKTIAEPPASGVVSGTVTRVKGQGSEPLAGTMISLRQSEGGGVTSVTTGADGTYRVDVPVADWRISALTSQFKVSVFPSIVSVTAGSNSTADFTFPEHFVPEVTLNKSVLALVSVATDANGKAAMPSVEFVSTDGQTRILGAVEQISDAELTKMGIRREAGANPWNWYEAKPDQALPTGTYTAQGKLAGYRPGTSSLKEVGEFLSVTFDLALSSIKSPDDTPIVPPIVTVVPEKPVMPDKPTPPVPADLPKVQVTVVDIEGIPIPGVNIRLVDKTRGKSLDEAAKALSNRQGVGSFELPDGFGDYAVMASLGGFEPAGDVVKVTQAAHSVSLVLHKEGVPRLVDLTAVVVEKTPGQESGHPDGRKVINALITFKAAAGKTLPEALTRSLRTDENGAFSAKGVTEGAYDVAILAEGYMEFSGNVQVVREMGEPLFALDPRNMARDNWIKMILTEGWGDSERSRQFHGKGLEAGGGDSNLDYALGLACLPSADDTTAIKGFTDAVGEVSAELWWDRACEGYIWTLMRYEKADIASDEIRRLASTYYNAREASSEAQATTNMMGVAVGVLIGPWSTEVSGGKYAKLDQDVMAMLQGPLRVAYIEGRDSVKTEFLKLTQAEQDAAKEMADKSMAEKNRMMAALEKEKLGIDTQQAENAKTIEAKNQSFDGYKNGAVAKATELTEQIAALKRTVTDQNAAYAQRIVEMRGEADARFRLRLQEINADLEGKIADITRIEAANQALTGGMADKEASAVGYREAIANAKTQLVQIRANIAAVKKQMEQAVADTKMQGNSEKRLREIQAGLEANAGAIQRQQNVVDDYPNTAFVGYDTEIQRIVDRLNVIQNQLPGARAKDQEAANNMNNSAVAGIQQALNANANQLRTLDANFANFSNTMGGNNKKLTQITTRIEAIQARLEAMGDISDLCEQCQRSAESPPNCPACAEVRRKSEVETLTLENEWRNLAAQWEQFNSGSEAEQANYTKAAAVYEQERNRLNQERNTLIESMNNPERGLGEGMGGVAAQLLKEDAALRKEYETVSSNRETFLNNDYARIDGANRQKLQNLIDASNDMENQYNAIAGNMNNRPDGNMQGGAQLDPLYAQEKQWQDYLEEVEAGLREIQNENPSSTMAGNDKMLVSLRQSAADLTAEYETIAEQISMVSSWQPNDEDILSDAKMSELLRKAKELQAGIEKLEANLLDVQTKFAKANEEHTKVFDGLNAIAADLTNKLNELGAKLAGLPDPVGKPVEGGADFSQLKKSFLSYRSYPFEQRRDELLNWVTRDSMSLR